MYLFFKKLVQKHKRECLFEACLLFLRYQHAKKKRLTGLSVIKKNICKADIMAVNKSFHSSLSLVIFVTIHIYADRRSVFNVNCKECRRNISRSDQTHMQTESSFVEIKYQRV